MTVYNGKYRCEGGQKYPADLVETSHGLFGECTYCHKFFRLYRNSKVVMHKRQVRAQVSP